MTNPCCVPAQKKTTGTKNLTSLGLGGSAGLIAGLAFPHAFCVTAILGGAASGLSGGSMLNLPQTGPYLLAGVVATAALGWAANKRNSLRPYFLGAASGLIGMSLAVAGNEVLNRHETPTTCNAKETIEAREMGLDCQTYQMLQGSYCRPKDLQNQ